MREAYLTGGNEHFDATDAPATTTPSAPLWPFSSVALTDDFNVTLTGNRYGSDATDEFTITRHCKPHPDLLRALRKLTLHMCLLTEQLSDKTLFAQPAGMRVVPNDFLARTALREAMSTGEAYVHELLEAFRCTTVTWKPKGVVLKGVRQARYRFVSSALKVETPVVEVRAGLDDEGDLAEWEYPYFEELGEALRELTAELVAFVGGKYGEGGQQLELFGKDAPAPSVLEAMENLNDALDTELRQRNHSVARSLAGMEAIFPTVPVEADEAQHAEQLQKDAAGDESTGLGTIQNPKKRPAKRKKVKGAGSE